jgi:WD40 repeat protein
MERRLDDHNSGVLDCDWSKDEKRMVSGSRDYSAIVWDLVNWTAEEVYSHPNCVRSTRWDRSEKYFLTSGIEEGAKLYDPAITEPLVIFEEGIKYKSNVMASRWSPDGMSFVSALGKSRYLILYTQQEPPPEPWYSFVFNKTYWGILIFTLVSIIAVFLLLWRPLKRKMRGRRG